MSDNQLCAVAFNAVSDHIHETMQFLGASLNTTTLFFQQGKLQTPEHEQLKFLLHKAQKSLEQTHELFLSIEPTGGLFELQNATARLT